MTYREIEMELPCDLNDQDVTERALQMSATMAEIDEVDSAKRENAKQFGERLQFLHGRLRRLGDAVRTRTERRIVRCLVNYHTPTVGVKQTLRMDTGELLKEETMTDAERQKHLFEPCDEGEDAALDSPAEAGGTAPG